MNGSAGRTLSGRLQSPGSARLCAALLLLYAAATGIGAYHHEPYRDEAQKWLLARDASIGELFAQLPYEGSPALWPLLLRPFARTGVPFAAAGGLAWACAAGAAALLLFSSRIPWPVKVAFLSSYGMLYEYPVVARNYILGILLFFAALALWPRRHERPWRLGAALFLLPNTATLMAPFALPLVLLLAGEAARAHPPRGRAWGAAALGAAGLLTLAVQIVPPRLGTGAIVEHNLLVPLEAATVTSALIDAFLPLGSWTLLPLVRSAWVAAAAVGAALALLGITLLRRPRALFLLAVSAGGIAAFLMRGSRMTYHALLIPVAVMGALWLAAAEQDEGAAARPTRPHPPLSGGASALAALLLGLSAPGAITMVTADVTGVYSSAREMAGYLSSTGLAGRPIAGFPAGASSALLPYLPGTRFYYPGLDEEGTYVKQGARLWSGEEISWKEILAKSLRKYGGAGSFLLLVNADMPGGGQPLCSLLHRSRTPIVRPDESYRIYHCEPPP